MPANCASPRRERRVETLYHPYHQALRQLVLETEAAFGGYLLIDCHSMPSAASEAGGQSPADIVLGDCHGTSCASEIVEAARSFLTRRNFAVALNAPYAGGFTTAHYGNPRRGRHACRSRSTGRCTWTSAAFAAKPELARLAAEMTALVAYLGEFMQRAARRGAARGGGISVPFGRSGDG